MPCANKLEIWKLERLKAHYKLETADDALEAALLAEDFKRGLTPGDPAFLHFAQQQIDLEQLAFLLEKTQ